MEKKSKGLIVLVILTLITSVMYSYYRYISFGDFLIDESQMEAVEMEESETAEEAVGEELPVFDEPVEPAMMEDQ